MSKQREAVRRWRARTKQRMIDSMGGKCATCTYDRCSEALEFHHLDPSKKDITLSTIRANPRSWSRIVAELRKCVLVCSNCHRELHAGMRHLPAYLPEFDESYAEYQMDAIHKLTLCPACGKPKPETHRTCSPKCRMSMAGKKIKWEQIDLSGLLKTRTPIQIADDFGVSVGAVYKRLRKIGRSTRAPYKELAPDLGLEPSSILVNSQPAHPVRCLE